LSAALRTLAGLLLGFLLGLAGGPGGVKIAAWIAREVLDPVGRAFLSLLEMGILPLVAAAVVLAVVRLGDFARAGRLGLSTILFFVPTLLLAAAIGVGVATLLLPVQAMSPEDVAALRSAAPTEVGQGAPPSLVEFLVDSVPRNPLAAAARGALLPVVVFCAFLGVGLLRMEESRRAPLVVLFEAVEAAMGKVLGWVLALAPLGVFALTASAVVEVGGDFLAKLLWFVVVVVAGLAVLLVAVLFPAARFLGGVPPLALERAALPAQAIALATTSSVASLPALLDSAIERLGVPRSTASLVLPLGVSIFRPGSAVFMVVAALFAARLYGVDVPVGTLLAAIPVAAFASFSVPSVPFGSFVAMAPVFTAVGAPIEAFGFLLAVDRVPDMLRTATNVTGTLVGSGSVSRSGETVPDPLERTGSGSFSAEPEKEPDPGA